MNSIILFTKLHKSNYLVGTSCYKSEVDSLYYSWAVQPEIILLPVKKKLLHRDTVEAGYGYTCGSRGFAILCFFYYLLWTSTRPVYSRCDRSLAVVWPCTTHASPGKLVRCKLTTTSTFVYSIYTPGILVHYQLDNYQCCGRGSCSRKSTGCSTISG